MKLLKLERLSYSRISFKRKWIKLLKLIKTTMPLIKYFEEINHVHRNLFNESLTVLTLIDLKLFKINTWWVLKHEGRQEYLLLSKFFL